ncbi:MAG TPA: Mu transposase C-terminal domain-containing protein, partial [Blastocatellia bacterium]
HGKNGEEKSYSRQFIEDLIYQWWRGGQTKNTLLGRSDFCGGPGKSRVQKDGGCKKLGRPSKRGRQTGVVLTSYWLNIIRLGAFLFFSNQAVKSVEKAYRDTLRVFCPKGKRPDGQDGWEIELPKASLGEVFSRRQFGYHLRKNLEEHLEEFFKKKYGKRRFNLRYRALNGSSRHQAPYPGALYQIDATIADVHLVSRLNKRHLIGRAVIVVVIDVFSGMIVGLCVRPEREKWTVINLALKNATEDKVAFCRRYGIEINPDDWPARGLSDSVCGDRGPMIGYNADNLADGLNISVLVTPAYRPDWKGLVERLFGLMNIYVIKQLPGALNPEQERGDRDVRLDAVLDLSQFTAIVIKAALFYNGRYIKDFPRTEEMVTANVPSIPTEIFKWGLRNLSGKPRHKDEELIYTHLLPAAEATVTAQGVKFKGEFYTCDKAEEEGWRFRARNKGRWRIPIGYDPRIPEIIYIRATDGSPSIPCRLMQPDDSLAQKYDLAEIEEYLDHKTPEDQLGDEQNIATRTALEISVEVDAEIATRLTAEARKGDPGMSNASKVKGAKEHMKAEAEMLDEEYRQQVLNELGLAGPLDTRSGRQDAADTPDEEYVPRPRFSNVTPIRERTVS